MSVLLEFAIFPTDKGDSVSKQVSKVIDLIRESGVNYQLTAMGTLIETDTLPEALAIVNRSYDVLAEDSERVYTTMNIDIQKGKNNRLKTKVEAIENKIGQVNK
ncbi:MTH1187 family thiamine-binding protein [Marinifilum sp. N1E240]|uniref:MTH1187 family thiamine-binding protein n=1 Tax=Marinifilum sp. N1E240 TaxID=2608082 RepID=UPI00128D133C|nr:MTH1187 family thiamine-binding protein [Marinifilum sp. N1E240]MPQ48047.1 MTH1187 family thiamine-binding protein [Marinifilum sp. N1E240]